MAIFQRRTKIGSLSPLYPANVDNRAHVLSAEQESLLAGAGEIFDASSDTFAVLNNADLVFPTIEGENGEIVHYLMAYGQLLESTDRRVREAAFKVVQCLRTI